MGIWGSSLWGSQFLFFFLPLLPSSFTLNACSIYGDSEGVKIPARAFRKAEASGRKEGANGRKAEESGREQEESGREPNCRFQEERCVLHCRVSMGWSSVESRGRSAGRILLTARDSIMRPVPPIAVRLSPRRSNSKTKAVARRVFSRILEWQGFEKLMESMAHRLNDSHEFFQPVVVSGNLNHYAAAADECEVRAPMQSIASLVNAVAKSMAIQSELLGGGSGRTISCTDYCVRLLSTEPPDPSQPGPSVTQQDPRRTDRNRGVLEVKGNWQWLAKGDLQLWEMESLSEKGLLDGLQQVYGDALMDNCRLACITSHDYAVLLRLMTDGSSRIHASPIIGLDRLLLALLVLLDEAAKSQPFSEEEKQRMSIVVTLPQEGDPQIQTRGTSRRSRTMGQKSSSSIQPSGRGQGKKRRVLSDVDGVDDAHVDVRLGSKAGPKNASVEGHEVFAFHEVGYSSEIIGEGYFGPVLKVRVHIVYCDYANVSFLFL